MLSLADTVRDFDAETHPDGNGFVFTDYTQEALLATVRRAVSAFRSGETWRKLVLRALASDFSWERSAERYEALYAGALPS